MSGSALNTQSAAARRQVEAQLDGLVAKIAPTQQKLVATLRRKLRKLLPTAHEVVYEYRDCVVISCSPSGHGYEGVFAIRVDADGVRLSFNQAKELPDPAKLLQGSGKLMRWIQVESAATLVRPEVADLIGEAIVRNPVPFASAGRGSVILSPVSAKRR